MSLRIAVLLYKLYYDVNYVSVLFCMVEILPSLTQINVSLLHLGQYSGKFNMTVSGLTFILVLPEQIGH